MRRQQNQKLEEGVKQKNVKRDTRRKKIEIGQKKRIQRLIVKRRGGKEEDRERGNNRKKGSKERRY